MHVARRGFAALLFAGSILGLAPLGAQGRSGGEWGVPPGHMPPPGMCRVWIDGVPPGRQPPPTDCTTAWRRAPRHARVIYTPEVRYYAKKGKHHKHHHDYRWDDRYERVIVIPDGGRRRMESTSVCISHDRTGVCVRQTR
jgi:hypothetical protein